MSQSITTQPSTEKVKNVFGFCEDANAAVIQEQEDTILLDAKIRKSSAIVESLFTQKKNVVCSTKFDSESIVFLHFIASIVPRIPIIWVDTTYNSRDTIAFVDEATNHLNLNLHIYKPKNHSMQVPPSKDDPTHTEFAETVKLAPFREALKTLDASYWISSVRSYQTVHRKTLTTQMKLSPQLTKVHPMLDWTAADMQAYQKKFNLPTGPVAYDPTKGHSKAECGLHTLGSFFF